MNNTTILPALLVILFTSTYCEAANILAVFPLALQSHQYFVQAVLKELALRGHQVTFYTSVPIGRNVSNVKEIHVNDPLRQVMSKEFNFKYIRDSCGIPYFKIPPVWFMGLYVIYETLNDPAIEKLIHSDEKYDLVLLETAFFQEALLAFGHKFKAPVITLHSFSTFFNIDEFVGNPFGASYIPTFELGYTDEMTFFQRVHNALRTFIFLIGTHTFYLPLQQFLMYRYFDYNGSETMPTIVDMLQNVSLVLANTQISVDYPRPWVPNIVGIGGIHISPVRQTLPKELKEFVDNSKNGVIYFSFGSLVPSEQMPENMKQGFINAFGKLEQNVLWKVQDDSITGLPKNVKTSQWLPQHDILAHPNCVAFITHGGLLSQEEAVYFGVPLIGVPFLGDQHLNVNRAVKRGFAINLDQYNITEESVLWALNEVLHKPMYRENAKKYSQIFHDNPRSPGDTTSFWVEYILRHNGAPHLQPEGRKLPYYKYLLLDVFAVFGVILILIVSTIYLIFGFIFRRLCGRKRVIIVAPRKKKN